MPKASPRARSAADPNAVSLMQAEDGKEKEEEVTIGAIRSPKQLWQWFIKDPCSRWQLIFFLGMFCLSIVFVIMTFADPDSSYTVSGVAGIMIAAYGAFHFKTLMALREEVETYEKHNNDFKRENAEMRVELDKLGKTKDELDSTRIGLQQATKKNKENLEKFEKISQNLELMGESSIDGMSKITDMTKGIAAKWKEELLSQERQLYMDVFEKLEMKDRDEEMTKAEYGDFLATLPAKYRMKIQHNYSFEKLAGNNDTLSYQEFSDLLDEMARNFSVTTKGDNVASSVGGGSDAAGSNSNGNSNIIEEE